MVYLFCADGTEEAEAVVTADIMRRAGVYLKIVGVGSKTITTSHGIIITADIEENGITDNFDMIVLPGGMPGTLNLEKSRAVQHAIDTALKKDRFIAAICAAPTILGHRGILNGKKAVCYPGYEDELEGAKIMNTQSCSDGKIITANGPGAVFAFGKEILSALGKNYEKVLSGMGVNL